MKIAFFGSDLIDKQKYRSLLRDHTVDFFDQNLTDDNIPGKKDFDVISVSVKSEVGKKIIEYFPDLKMISVRATGFDKIDVNFANEKKILVCNVPGYGSHTVEEFTFGLMLSLTRNIFQAINRVKNEKSFGSRDLMGRDLFGMNLGVIGTGKIGANVIKIAKGFGMIVLAYNPHPNETLAGDLGFKYVSLEELLKKSDIITLHCSLNDRTFHLINKHSFFLMKDGALMINTARGAVVDTYALLDALKSKKLAGAGIDVLEKEEYMGSDIDKMSSEIESIIEANLELINLPNVLVSPHIAFDTAQAQQIIIETTAHNILAFIKGSPVNIVNEK